MIAVRLGDILPEDIFRLLLDREIKRALREEFYFSLMMFKLSGRDDHDHLSDAVGMVRGQIRETDDRGIVGGSRVAAILPTVDDDYLGEIITRIEPLILNHPRCSGLSPCTYRIAVGGAAFPIHGTTSADLIEAADRNCR